MPIQCRQVRVDKLKSSRLFFAILVAAFAASGGSCGGTVLSTNGAQAWFAPSPCPALPALANARCGYLVVPEDRAQPTGHTIRLLVAIIPARSARAKSDPVVYLAGGPGGIAMAEAPILIEAGINRDRDLILMDQRGTLYSEPALTCPDMDQFFVRSVGLPLDAPSTGLLHAAAARACYLRSVATGRDLSAYNTSESAADFAALRTALGITQWNVFGVSYGTNLALTLMREHPEGIRSVVIDSVEPPSVVNVGRFWGNASEGFDNLFRACAEQPTCWTRQPGFAETFTALVRKLESNPVTTSVRAVVGQPPTKVVIDGGALVNWLVNMSFATEDYPHVPAWIGELADGHAENIALSIAKPVLATPAGYIGYGLTYGVICSEWVPYESESDVLLQGRLAFPDYPDSVLAPAVHFSYVYDDCRGWNVRQGPPAQRAVTRSTIPTLILSGGFDAVTPPSWGKIAARTLSNSTDVVIPGVGHFAASVSGCAQRVIASFLAKPNAPETSCVGALRPPSFLPAFSMKKPRGQP
jgi:pimeloyl-ACP methyl ester carboxylesterase